MKKYFSRVFNSLNPYSSILNPHAGQALVEIIVALAVLTVGFVGSITLFSTSIALNRVVSDKYVATYLAAEGIEVVKNMIDEKSQFDVWACSPDCSFGTFGTTPNLEVEYNTDWNTNPPLSVTSGSEHYLCFNSASGLYFYDIGFGCSGMETSSFKRRVEVRLLDADGDASNGFQPQQEIQINSIVTWSTRGSAQEINLEDHFYNWKP